MLDGDLTRLAAFPAVRPGTSRDNWNELMKPSSSGYGMVTRDSDTAYYTIPSLTWC
jgi:hypothetical protein